MADVAATSPCKKRPQDGGDQRQADGKLKQDKVNYAVSERENRVTGATKLTRMAGCNRIYWPATVLC